MHLGPIIFIYQGLHSAEPQQVEGSALSATKAHVDLPATCHVARRGCPIPGEKGLSLSLSQSQILHLSLSLSLILEWWLGAAVIGWHWGAGHGAVCFALRTSQEQQWN